MLSFKGKRAATATCRLVNLSHRFLRSILRVRFRVGLATNASKGTFLFVSRMERVRRVNQVLSFRDGVAVRVHWYQKVGASILVLFGGHHASGAIQFVINVGLAYRSGTILYVDRPRARRGSRRRSVSSVLRGRPVLFFLVVRNLVCRVCSHS